MNIKLDFKVWKSEFSIAKVWVVSRDEMRFIGFCLLGLCFRFGIGVKQS